MTSRRKMLKTTMRRKSQPMTRPNAEISESSRKN
jgi:hypothetical protein